MKRAITVLLLVVAFAVPAIAQSESPAQTYIHTLNEISGNCEVAAFSLALDDDLAATKQRMDAQVAMANGRQPDDPASDANLAAGQARVKPFGDCIQGAKEKGAQAYKAFISTTHDATMRTAAKKVFAAWLAYVPAIKVTSDADEQHSGLEYAALQEAISNFNVEALTQN